MKTRDTRTDSGQYYPGGKVIPRQPVRPGGGSDADAVHYYAETRTDDQKAQARQNIGAAASGDIPILDPSMTTTGPTEDGHGLTKRGIWSWVKSLLPNWLTSNYDEPATVESVNQKYTKPSDGIPKSDLNANVQSSLNKADTASQPGHTHPQAQVAGLADALEAKAPVSHSHDKIVDGAKEVRADLTAKVPSGWTNLWEPWESGEYYTVIWDNFNVDLGFVWCTVDSSSNFVVMGGDYTNPEATELTFPDDTVTRRVPATAEKTIATTDQLPTAAQLLTDEQRTEIAKVKDKADEFTAWVVSGRSEPERYRVVWVQNKWNIEFLSNPGEESEHWIWLGYSPTATGDSTFISDFEGDTQFDDVTATRQRVLRTGEALAPGLSAQGVPTDPNVAELFSESNTLLAAAVDAKAATSAANIPDRGVAVVDGSSGTAASKQTVTVSFAAAKGTELRMCELLITDVAEDDAVTVSLPAGTYQFADGADATKKADGNHFIFTEYARGCWFVNRVSTTESEVA